jgi:hypothetical protein
MSRSVPEIAVVAAVKAFAHSIGQPIDYVPDIDVLGVIQDLINAAPATFPGLVDYGGDPGPTDVPRRAA